jgi:hypothetical protein
MFNDILYRPPELDSTCVWDITRQLIKEKKPNDFALSLLRAIFMSREKQSSGLELGSEEGHQSYWTGLELG